MVLDQDRQEIHLVDNNSKLLHQRLSVEEVVRSNKEVPRERSEPGQVVHLVDGVANIDDLGEALNITFLVENIWLISTPPLTCTKKVVNMRASGPP